MIDFSSKKYSGSTGHRNSWTSKEIYSEDAEGETRTHNSWIMNPVLQPLSYTAQKLLLGRSWVYPIGVLHHIFIISQLWLTSHLRSTAGLLETETPGSRSSREIYGEDAEDETGTRNPWITNQCSSHWAIQLKNYCWEGVEFIQLVYCIIYLSFLNCGWLLIREVLRFYWKQKLLVLLAVEKFTVRMPKVRLELATPGLQTGALAIELYSSEAIAGKESSLSSWCIASLYIYHFSTVIDFSSEKYSGSTGHRNSWYQ